MVRHDLKADLSAGLVVFLVALPLCLGIALASGAPLFAGVIAGIVGGTVVAILSGSEVSVSGPAAGLAVIVATAIQNLGKFEIFLTAVVCSGVLQVALGLARLGSLSNYVPNAVIKGMLAAIGIVIVLKQIPHALGRDKDYEGDLSFLEAAGENTLTDIVHAVLSMNGPAVAISAISLAVLLLWERPEIKRMAWLRAVPGPLIVVALGIGLNELFRVAFGSFYLSDPEHLVRLPVSANLREFFGQFRWPDFAALSDRRVYTTAATLAVVASLESLLSLEAADKLDPQKRISSPNRELVAQGLGNFISGLIGGLPVTSVVVRTSANIYAGARTRWSSFTHGILLLVAVLAIPGVLNRTPLAALAAILIVIGYRLARIDLFRNMYAAGWGQFLPFIVTVVAIVLSDLLIGVAIGLVVGLFFVIRANHHQPLTLVNQDSYYLLRLNKDATFIHKAAIKDMLRSIPNNSHLTIDGTKALYIDHDIAEVVEEFRHSAEFKNITIETKNFENRRGVSTYRPAMAAH
ncbi:MAG: SulP family inorganic anion transporter [Bryobacteraceae bacterium]|nr:SulP family inorganic anion transporter [Bryobacteraceae bacterium]